MRVRMNRARVALGPSPSTPTTVLVAESTPPTVGAADRPLRGAFSASRPSPRHFPRRVRPRDALADPTRHRTASPRARWEVRVTPGAPSAAAASVRCVSPNPPRLANLVAFVSARAPPPTRR